MRSRCTLLALVSVVTLGGCPADDGAAPGRDSGPPLTPGPLEPRGVPCTEGGLTFLPRTLVGQTSTRLLELANVGDAAVLIEQTAVEGPDAAEVTVLAPDPVNDASCIFIPIHQHEHTVSARGSCRLALHFQPTTAGSKHATLHVTGTGFDQSIELTAVSRVAPPPNLVPSVPDLFFDRAGSTASFQVVHHGPEPIVLGDPVLPPGFDLTSWNCPPTMKPGAACSIAVRYQPAPTAFGCQGGHLSLSGLATDLDVYLRAPGHVPLLAVAVTGSGRVTSAPAGIACGPARVCTGAFDGAPPVTLTAATGARFTGWNQRSSWAVDGESGTSTNACGVAPTCVVPSDHFYVEALFTSLLGKRIEVTVVGAGSVQASWNLGATAVTCSESCRLYVEPGTAVTLTAATGTLTGWAGDCSGADPVCQLGDVVADRAITARF